MKEIKTKEIVTKKDYFDNRGTYDFFKLMAACNSPSYINIEKQRIDFDYSMNSLIKDFINLINEINLYYKYETHDVKIMVSESLILNNINLNNRSYEKAYFMYLSVDRTFNIIKYLEKDFE